MLHVDVAVVGGGPAGSSAGAAAAATGADVVVLEQGVPRAERDLPGPDSTDAAAFLDYWVDLAGVDYADIPDELITQPIDAATFSGPTERVTLHETGRSSSCPSFAFTFDRVGFDDWLRDRAEAAGADYRVGTTVRDVETTRDFGTTHVLTLQDGSRLHADALVLADGPQRRVTLPTLEQFLPDDRILEVLDPITVNHVGYQEYRRFPPELFTANELGFWWGLMPGHTAYCWIFPDAQPVARVGFTRPLALHDGDLDGAYRLIEPDDETVPGGRETIRRFLGVLFGDAYDVEADFPVVTSRGKHKGTETYPISSTRPIESPTGANVAVTGGAMGATSAFHEGGYYLAMRTGSIAGRLAGLGELNAYNESWQQAVGTDVRLNSAVADMVEGYGPADWDRAFRVAREMGYERHAFRYHKLATPTGLAALGFLARYGFRWWRCRGNRVVGLREREYEYGSA